jgi:hypothetical protein
MTYTWIRLRRVLHLLPTGFVALLLIAWYQPCLSKERCLNRIEFEGKQWLSDVDNRLEVESVDDLPAMRVTGTTPYVYLPNAQFKDGTIEVHLAPGQRGLAGIGFHGGSDEKRLDRLALLVVKDSSTTQEVMQQAVVTKDGQGTLLLLRLKTTRSSDIWIRVKVVVRDARVDIYVNGDARPVFSVDNVLNESVPGTVGVWGKQGFHFAHFRYTASDAP